MIEQLVRETLSTEATRTTPLPLDGWEALRRGQRAKTRRRIAVPVAAVVAVVAVSAGAGVVTANVERRPVVPLAPSASATASPQHKTGVVQVRDNELRTADGRRFPLPKIGDSKFETWLRIQPVYGGWVVNSTGKAVWVRTDGHPSVLVDLPIGRQAGVLASPDGRKVAVTKLNADNSMSTITVLDLPTGKTIGATEVNAGRPDAFPMPYLWFGDQLVLAHWDNAPFTLWDPASGRWHGRFTGPKGEGLAGTTADGKRMIGYTTAKDNFCVGFVDPARDFAMSGQTCDPARKGQLPFPSLSPDRSRLTFLDIQAKSGLWTASVNGDRIVADRPLTAPPSSPDRAVVWDGNKTIYYQESANFNWATCDLGTGQCHVLPHTADLLYGPRNPPGGG